MLVINRKEHYLAWKNNSPLNIYFHYDAIINLISLHNSMTHQCTIKNKWNQEKTRK